MDSGGHAYVMLHELLVQDVCDASPEIYGSKIYVARWDGVALTVQGNEDAAWPLGEPNLSALAPLQAYLDHPAMAITSDDVQHFAWLVACWEGCTSTIYYRKREPGGDYEAPIAIAIGLFEIGVPHVVVDGADNVYVLWTNKEDNDLHVCRVDNGGCVDGVVNATEPIQACADALPSYIAFPDEASILELRHGGLGVAAGTDVAEHLLAAFQVKEGTVGTEECSLLGPGAWDVAFTESFDGGQTWLPAVVVSTLPEQQGSDQFMPSVASQDDGTILITYYDRSNDPAGGTGHQMIAIRDPGQTTWRIGRRMPEATESLAFSRLPPKCGEWPTRFLGEYHAAIGGRSHVHGLRLESDSEGSGTARLRSSVVSASSWE